MKAEISKQLGQAGLKNKDMAHMAEMILAEKRKDYDLEIKQIESQLHQISRKKKEQFLLYKEGRISKDNYLMIKEEKEKDEAFLERRKLYLEEQKNRAVRKIQQEKKFLKCLLDAESVQELNAELVEALVEKVSLYGDKHLEIRFRFLEAGEDE